MAIALSLSTTGLVLAGGSSLPSAEGQAVYDYITKTNPYQNWSLFPGKGELYEGKHPHGALLTSYVNEVALNGINNKVGTLADGAIIIKENYMPDKTLGAVTVMYRVKGYDPMEQTARSQKKGRSPDVSAVTRPPSATIGSSLAL
jgi:hypothetical protein